MAPSNARAARVWDLTFVVLAGPEVEVVVAHFVHSPNTTQYLLITSTHSVYGSRQFITRF